MFQQLRVGEVAQVVEHQASKHETLNSNPSTDQHHHQQTNKQNKKTKKPTKINSLAHSN
jgi:hypothetical protein